MTDSKPRDGAIPTIGDWLVPRDGTHPNTRPGIVVDILPSGKQAVLSRRLYSGSITVESVHNTEDLKGPMNGRVVTA